MANSCFISFITPIYNEEQNIANMLANFHKVLADNPHWDYESILIEDGSADNTRQVLQEEIKKYPKTKLILHDQNKGYTASMKDGIAEANGRYLMYIGADEEFDCSELPSFVDPLASDKADIVLGVRWQRNAYGLFRFFISVIYIFFLNGIFNIRINDYNWSQAWSRKVLDSITIESKSLFMLPEIIVKAHDLKYRILEVPSNHRGRYWGKSSLNMKIMGHALIEGLQFWWRRKSKNYRAGSSVPEEEPKNNTNTSKETHQVSS